MSEISGEFRSQYKFSSLLGMSFSIEDMREMLIFMLQCPSPKNSVRNREDVEKIFDLIRDLKKD